MNRNFFYLLLIGLLLIAGVCVIEAHALPDNETSQNLTANTTGITPYVHQGDTLYFGYIYDFSGILPWKIWTFAWFYNPDIEDIPDATINLTALEYRHVLIDDRFHVGPWYKWDNGAWVKGENQLAFRVEYEPPPENLTATVNETAINRTPYNITAQSILPTRHIADVLVAKSDDLIYNNTEITDKSSVWIFGLKDGLYNLSHAVNSTLVVNKSILENMADGEYQIVIVNPGNNSIREVLWNESKKRVESPFRSAPDLDAAEYDLVNAPPVFYTKLMDWISRYTDDEVSEYTLSIQEPMVEISDILETNMNAGYAVIQVSGYTNIAENTTVTCIFDEKRQTPETLRYVTYRTNALQYSIGDKRQYRVNVLVDYKSIAAGQHDMTVYTPSGAFARVPFYVYDMPEGSQRPTGYVRYINGSEWRPDPTPVIIKEREIVTQQVIQYVTVPVPPAVEVVQEEQRKAIYDLAGTVVVYLIAGIVVIGIIGYIGYSFWRARKI